MSLINNTAGENEQANSKFSNVKLNKMPPLAKQVQSKIVAIADMGMIQQPYNNEIKVVHKLHVLYACDCNARDSATNEVPTNLSDIEQVTFTEKINFGMSPKGGFVKEFLTPMGATYEKTDYLSKFLGAPMILVFGENVSENNGKTYTNIISKVGAGAEGCECRNVYIPWFWIGDKEGNPALVRQMKGDFKRWQITAVNKETGKFDTYPEVLDIAERFELMTVEKPLEYCQSDDSMKGLNPKYQKRDTVATAPEVTQAPAENATAPETKPEGEERIWN